MRVLTSPTFNRHAKKLHPNEKQALDGAVREIMINPQLGDQKRGDLGGFYIYKYRFRDQLWLLAYTVDSEESLTLRLVGAHENFYKALKRNVGK